MYRCPLGWLLVLYVAKKKKKTTGPVYFINVRTKSRSDRVKEALKTQLINIRQSQTTQLLLHNCPIK